MQNATGLYVTTSGTPDRHFSPREPLLVHLEKMACYFLITGGASMPTIKDRIVSRTQHLGALTCGGKLNRTSLRRCVLMMQRLLPVLLLVWIDHGEDEDYPPTETGNLRSRL
jgi:hypothetical protein